MRSLKGTASLLPRVTLEGNSSNNNNKKMLIVVGSPWGSSKGTKEKKTGSFKPVILKYAAAPKCEPEYFKETSNILK